MDLRLGLNEVLRAIILSNFILQVAVWHAALNVWERGPDFAAVAGPRGLRRWVRRPPAQLTATMRTRSGRVLQTVSQWAPEILPLGEDEPGHRPRGPISLEGTSSCMSCVVPCRLNLRPWISSGTPRPLPCRHHDTMMATKSDLGGTRGSAAKGMGRPSPSRLAGLRDRCPPA